MHREAAGPAAAAAPEGFRSVEAWAALAQTLTLESDEAFAAAWLALQCAQIDGVVAGVVVLSTAEGYAPVARWPEAQAPSESMMGVAELALGEGQGAVRQRQGPRGAAPVQAALAYPLLTAETDAQTRGVVAIEVGAADEAALATAMRALQWGCAWWQRRFAAAAGREERSLRTVLDLLATSLEEAGYEAAALAAATRMAVLLDCERVCVSELSGRHNRLVAVSHSADFDRRSSLLRAVSAAMDEATDQQDLVAVPAVARAAGRVTRCHELLLEQNDCAAVCTVPLVSDGELRGAVTLERRSEPFTGEELALATHAAALLAPVLEARRRDDRWLILKAWDAGADLARQLLGPRHLVAKLVGIAAVAVLAVLSTATGTFRVTADAELEGAIQRVVIAPQDGFVAAAGVRAGDLVEAGQLLAELEDDELELARVREEGEREKLRREYTRALARQDSAEVRILRAQIEQAEARIALLAEQLERTRIIAPFAGVVVEGDLSQRLGAPVSRGDVLFEVAPLEGYRVMLQVDERDITEVAVGQQGQLALASFPGEPLDLVVEKITPVAVVREGRNLFRVEATLADPDDAIRPGMQGVAKVEVDERRLIWIWTRRLTHFLRQQWWYWWP